MAVRVGQPPIPNDGLWDRNLETDEVYYSGRWKSMLGYSEEEIEHTLAAFDRLIHPDDRGRRLDAINAYLSGAAERYEIELRMRHAVHADGACVRGEIGAAIIWVSIDARTVRDERGAVKYYEGSLTDITDRKEAEQMKSDFST